MLPPYLPQLRAVMRVHRPLGPRSLATAAAAQAQSGRCPGGLPGAHDPRCLAAAVCHGARRLHPGRRRAQPSLRGGQPPPGGGAWLVRWAIQQADQPDAPTGIDITRADSLAAQHKHTRPIEGGAGHYAQRASTKRRSHDQYGLTYLAWTVAGGTLTVPCDLRLSLRASPVRRINRRRVPPQRRQFVSKLRVARRMLEALRPVLPRGWAVTVQFASW